MVEPGSRRFVLPDFKAQIIFWSLLVAGLLFDLWTKSAVFAWLDGRPQGISLIDGFLRFVAALNDGAAFNIFASNTLFLISISGVAILLVLGLFLFGGSRHRLVHVALGCFAAGICGNLYDRAFNGGQVRDFINVYVRIFGTEHHWPAFNVADSMLCIGVGLLIISTVIAGQSDRKHAQQHK